jgi:hypothetical protein
VAATLQVALILCQQSEHGWQRPASALMQAVCPARQCASCSKVRCVLTVVSAVLEKHVSSVFVSHDVMLLKLEREIGL